MFSKLWKSPKFIGEIRASPQLLLQNISERFVLGSFQYLGVLWFCGVGGTQTHEFGVCHPLRDPSGNAQAPKFCLWSFPRLGAFSWELLLASA